MSNPFDHEDRDLDHAITEALHEMTSFSVDDEGYQKAVDSLTKLYAIREKTALLNHQAQTATAAHKLAAEAHQLAITQQELSDRQHQLEVEKLTLERDKHSLDTDKHQLERDQNTWQEEQDQRPFLHRVDPNTVVTVAGNLAIALFVVKYERSAVVVTKVASFLRKI